MRLKFTCLTVSKNFRWYEQEKKFRDVRTDALRSDSDYEAKLDVFEDRVQGWFLDCSTSLLGQSNFAGDYVALSVALPYIEGVEQYRQGSDTPEYQAGAWFRRSAKRILAPASTEEIAMLYRSARNGLFHSGFTTGRVYLNYDVPTALSLMRTPEKTSELRINPRLFVRSVDKDFSAYVEDLRRSSSSQAAKRFEKLWDERWKNS